MIFKFSFFDGTQETVSDIIGERIVAALDQGAEWIELNGNRFNAKSLSSIRKEISLNSHIGFQDHRILSAPTTELTEEQREKNIARLREMKKEFVQRIQDRDQVKLSEKVNEKLKELGDDQHRIER